MMLGLHTESPNGAPQQRVACPLVGSYSQLLLIFPEEDSNDEEDEDDWETGAPPRELLDTSNYERSEGVGGHRQFDMKQLLTEQDEDTIGEYLKRKYADSHERRSAQCVVHQ